MSRFTTQVTRETAHRETSNILLFIVLTARIGHFQNCVQTALAFEWSEAEGELVLFQSLLLFMSKSCSSHATRPVIM